MLKSCTKQWLWELAAGTTCVVEMQVIENAFDNEELPLQKLFEYEGIASKGCDFHSHMGKGRQWTIRRAVGAYTQKL